MYVRAPCVSPSPQHLPRGRQGPRWWHRAGHTTASARRREREAREMMERGGGVHLTWTTRSLHLPAHHDAHSHALNASLKDDCVSALCVLVPIAWRVSNICDNPAAAEASSNAEIVVCSPPPFFQHFLEPHINPNHNHSDNNKNIS